MLIGWFISKELAFNGTVLGNRYYRRDDGIPSHRIESISRIVTSYS